MARQHQGRMSHFAGDAAEQRIATDYERRGFPVAARRWRGAGGEIDLIFHDGDGLIFVEVKQSRSFDSAASHLSVRQIQRLQQTAEEYLGTMPNGSLTDVRFDVALVNAQGDFQVIENALCA